MVTPEPRARVLLSWTPGSPGAGISPRSGQGSLSRGDHAAAQWHKLPSLCRDPESCVRVDRAPGGAPTPVCRWLRSAPRRLPTPSRWSSPGGPDRGSGCLPLGREVAGWLPPRVASGQGPQQQERYAGGPEQQSGPHDRQRRVPGSAWLRRRAGEGAAGPRPSSWRRGERTSDPRAGTRSCEGGWGRREEGLGAAADR